jgi:pectinesterase
MRTFSSYTLLLGADGIGASGISIVNDAGWGESVGQAMALYADADRLRLSRCAIRSRQDSLFLGPLPPEPIEGSDFGGPREGLPRRQGRQLYEGCLIEGDVDFIFGSAAALFRKCRIVSLHRPGAEGPQGYVCAPSTPEGAEIGLVFDSCTLEAGHGLPEGSVFLARPWRDEGRAVFDRCKTGKHVKKELWDDWGKTRAREKCFFACLDCRGPAVLASAPRPGWEKKITRAELDSIYARFDAAFPSSKDARAGCAS